MRACVIGSLKISSRLGSLADFNQFTRMGEAPFRDFGKSLT
jgi:hypothetical protein